MRLRKFFREVSTTAACTLRLITSSVFSGRKLSKERKQAFETERRSLIVCDSWFGSVRLAEAVKLLWREDNGEYKINKERGVNPNSHELIAAVKTNHSWFPKQFLEQKMKSWPSGAYLVLECRTPETKVDLVAIGYKYNSKKVLCFVHTKNAGSTAPGLKPYVAKFPDRFGNTKERRVPRPEVISEYFDKSHMVDAHNHNRQHILGLETYWKTKNPWTRNNFTLVGMTAVDCFKAIRYHIEELRVQDFTTEAFADCLAWDCLYNDLFTKKASSARLFLEPAPGSCPENEIRDGFRLAAAAYIDAFGSRMMQMFEDNTMIDCCIGGGVLQQSVISPLSAGSSQQEVSSQQVAVELVDIGDHDAIAIDHHDSNGRSVKRRCTVCGKDTRWMCNHAECRSIHRSTGKNGRRTLNGTWICPPGCGPRSNLPKYPNNELPCLQLHRNELKQKKIRMIQDRLSSED